MSVTTPQRVLDGKYRLEDRLGEGANGVVYRALHLGLKKSFAVKLLQEGSLDPGSLARFRREAEALGQLRHPHVVEVTDFGIDTAAGDVPYLVMELLDGQTLADLCRARGPLPVEQALPLLASIAEAIDAAHAGGVLHRDLKPGNVLLCPGADGAWLVKVLDFGLAEIVGMGCEPPGEESPADGRLTATGALLGTPLYAAPELIRQEAASRASDVYAFGVIAYELLAGHPPFRGSTRDVLDGHLEGAPPAPAPLGEPLPREVWEALQEPLRKDPTARP
ncbi:MAG TPA: serine/threonine protein kinase, partial [Acidobacteria bacterium]|nr:serine/threonine protein kinase [Acidobacteriota bacterium]